jgi:hypothetical protein
MLHLEFAAGAIVLLPHAEPSPGGIGRRSFQSVLCILSRGMRIAFFVDRDAIIGG